MIKITRRQFYRGTPFYDGCYQLTVERWLEMVMQSNSFAKPQKTIIMLQDYHITEATPKLRAFCLYLCKERDRANDLFQDTVLRALNNKEKYKEDVSAVAWLSRIAKNIFLDWCKKSKTHKTSYVEELPEIYTQDNGSEVLFVIEDIDKASMNLRGKEKETYMLHKDGHSPEVIAAKTEMPVANVNQYLRQANRKIKVKMKEYRN